MPGYVTIDYGSVVSNGDDIREFTPGYPLDAPPIGSFRWDLNCVASTLFVLASGHEHSFRQRAALREYATNHPSVVFSVIIHCLDDSTTSDNLWEGALAIVSQNHAQIVPELLRVRATKRV
jgi:hypothetical protein